MAEVFGFNLPDFDLGFGISGSTIAIVATIFIIFIIIITGGIVIYTHRLFNRKVIVFENIAGQGFQPSFRDKARLIKLGDGGEEILYLKKKKVYRSAYGRKMGKNTYWFAVGQDGYWYNVILGDVDAKMGMLDIEPIDRDMRYMHTAIRRNIQDRYQKQKFMEKYGVVMMSGIFLIIILIGVWLLLSKIGDINTAAAGTIDASKKVIDKAGEILSSLDNICTQQGGSGLVETGG